MLPMLFLKYLLKKEKWTDPNPSNFSKYPIYELRHDAIILSNEGR